MDHFVSRSRYSAGLGHNFILAHDRRNGAKSDFLAAEYYLAAWVERNARHGTELREWAAAAGLACDPAAAAQIARLVYQQTAASNGQVWVEGKVVDDASPGLDVWCRRSATPLESP